MLSLDDREAAQLYGFALELSKHASVGSVGIGRPQESALALDRRLMELAPEDRTKVAVLLDVMSPGGAVREAGRPTTSMVKTAIIGKLLSRIPVIGRALAGGAREAAPIISRLEAGGAPSWLAKTYGHFAAQPSWAKALALGGAGYEGYLAQQGEISPLQAALGIGLSFAPISGAKAIGGSLANVFITPRIEQSLGLWTPPAEREARGMEQGYQMAGQDYQQLMAQQQQQMQQQMLQQQQIAQQQAAAQRPNLWESASSIAAENMMPLMPQRLPYGEFA